jgi:hypothetical protein
MVSEFCQRNLEVAIGALDRRKHLGHAARRGLGWAGQHRLKSVVSG